MDDVGRWRENWRAVAPPGAVRLDVPRRRDPRRELAARLRHLPPGAPVVLAAASPFAGRRCRRVAASAGIEIDTAYLALPSAAQPAFLIEDHASSISHFLGTMLVVPPGRLSPLLDRVAAAVRRLRPWRAARLAVPGRLVVGRRV